MTPEERDYQHRMRVWEGQLQSFAIHTDAVIGFASLSIKSIILANSASAGAVLAFLGTMWGDPIIENVVSPALSSISVFVSGIFSAIICACLSYFTQYCYMAADQSNTESKTYRILSGIGAFTHGLALGAAVVGVLSFGLGAHAGLKALDLAKGGVTERATFQSSDPAINLFIIPI